MVFFAGYLGALRDISRGVMDGLIPPFMDFFGGAQTLWTEVLGGEVRCVELGRRCYNVVDLTV